jgi:hypothetical protein
MYSRRVSGRKIQLKHVVRNSSHASTQAKVGEGEEMTDGITVWMLGDYGPFSRVGKSIGYQVTIGDSSFLVDCGSPLFQKIGGHGLKNVKGLIITHCHDDHKRWFSDLALFNMYAPDITHRVSLMTSEEINEGLIRGSLPSLETSLSPDSTRVIDIAYDEYIDFSIISPRPRYRIIDKDMGGGRSQLMVVDRNGEQIGPERAKIVVSNLTGRRRMLFRDPHNGEWIEPETYYPFSSEVFYEKEQNSYLSPEGFTIEAINSPVWHGVPSIGLKFATAEESVIFSADTNHDLDLWKRLCSEKFVRNSPLSDAEFAAASIIYGDINDYIERVWSEERYLEAINAFDGAVVIHDIAVKRSVVHTDYRRLEQTTLNRKRTILTHSPDKMTSEWVLGTGDKIFWVKGEEFYEIIGNEVFPFTADLYHKEDGHYYVGYRNPEGKNAVYTDDGVLSMCSDPYRGEGELYFRMDLYEDIGGRYFPILEDSSEEYHLRGDGRVERVKSSPDGSSGVVVEDIRAKLISPPIVKVAAPALVISEAV